MCGCEKHFDKAKPCTCICDEHANFEVARDLAFKRYDIIKQLSAEVERLQAQVDQVRDLISDFYVNGREADVEAVAITWDKASGLLLRALEESNE